MDKTTTNSKSKLSKRILIGGAIAFGLFYTFLTIFVCIAFIYAFTGGLEWAMDGTYQPKTNQIKEEEVEQGGNTPETKLPQQDPSKPLETPPTEVPQAESNSFDYDQIQSFLQMSIENAGAYPNNVDSISFVKDTVTIKVTYNEKYRGKEYGKSHSVPVIEYVYDNKFDNVKYVNFVSNEFILKTSLETYTEYLKVYKNQGIDFAIDVLRVK